MMATSQRTTKDVFLCFVREHLVPNLKACDIVVMDNLRVHKSQEVRELIESAQAKYCLFRRIRLNSTPSRRLGQR